MASDGICAACGSRVERFDENTVVCANPQCPAGRYFWLCPFCGQHTLACAPDQMRCFNPDCRLYMVRRDECPACRQISLISFLGAKMCMNWRQPCPDNRATIRQCGACGNVSLVKAGDNYVCVKRGCENLMRSVGPCGVCGAMSVDVDTGRCRNSSCQVYNVRTRQCPACGKRALAEDPSHASFGKCLSCGYAEGHGDSAPAPPPPGRAALPTIMVGTAEAAGGAAGGVVKAGAARPASKPRWSVGAGAGAPGEAAGATGRGDSGRPPAAAAEGGGEGPRAEPARRAPPAGDAPRATAGSPPPQPANKRSPERPPELSGVGARPVEAAPAGGNAGIAPGRGGVESAREGGWTSGAKRPEAAARASEADWAAPKPQQWAAPPTRTEDEQPSAEQVAKVREAVAHARPVERGTKADASIIEAFEFVRDYILSDGERDYPVYLVIGLSGSGKTTYLTVLGEILRARGTKYYFPYEGIDVKPVRIEEIAERRERASGTPRPPDLHRYRRRILDLIHDFAQQNYSQYIGRMQWAGATVREAPGEVSTHFLIAEVTRHLHTIAKIVTLETSGEDYEDVLRGIRAFNPAEDTRNPLHRVLYELLDIAEGFIVLVMPDDPKNDTVFRDFFLMVKEALEPRGLNMFRDEVKNRLLSMSPAEASKTGGKGFLDVLRKIQVEEELRKKRLEERRQEGERYIAQLRQLEEQLKAEGPSALLAPQAASLLQDLLEDYGRLNPEEVARVNDILNERARRGELDKETFVPFGLGLIKRLTAAMPQIMLERQKRRQTTERHAVREDDIPPDLWKQVLIDIRTKHNLKDFEVAREAVVEDDRPVRRMRNLKHIAIVITQTDMYPTIWPPENFPAKMLPQCNMHLPAIDNWLRLCGGGVRYYNCSATGYSILRDTLYYPGKENTQTPINVLEPLFDMLGLGEP
ncbi:MAG: hypothetical protein N3A38_00205 [Planctomycetota bacterium]|nr:hypothetical protein [Planctomycetota bacterium]